jgi:hypothetical protein
MRVYLTCCRLALAYESLASPYRNLRTLVTWIVLQLTVAIAAGCVPVVRRAREGTVSLAVWEARSRVLVSVHRIFAVHVLVVDVKLSLVLCVLFVKQLMQIGLGSRMEDVSFRSARGVAVDLHHMYGRGEKRGALRALERSWMLGL